MRIVAVADTHLFHDELVIPDGDVFVHAGDFCRKGDLDETKRAMDWIASLPHPTKIVVAGNHDVAFEREREAARALLPKDVVYLEDTSTTLDGVHFYGSPWVVEHGGWAFSCKRGAELAEKWTKIPSDVHVLITHGPPRGHGDAPERYGCDDLLARIREVRPRLHLFGHIHVGGGVTLEGGTTCVNVTTYDCTRRATVIDYPPRGAVAILSDTTERGERRGSRSK